MSKIKVIVDSSAPNYQKVKKTLEDNGMEVILCESNDNFDDALLKQINELKEFESRYFKNPHLEKGLSNIVFENQKYPKQDKAKAKI